MLLMRHVTNTKRLVQPHCFHMNDLNVYFCRLITELS